MVLNGREIVRLREARGLSQADLARLVGMPTNTLCQYERGQRGNRHSKRWPDGRLHPSVGVRIAKALGVELDTICKPKPADEASEATAA